MVPAPPVGNAPNLDLKRHITNSIKDSLSANNTTSTLTATMSSTEVMYSDLKARSGTSSGVNNTVHWKTTTAPSVSGATSASDRRKSFDDIDDT